jgi:putative aldouronate transport system permease protein
MAIQRSKGSKAFDIFNHVFLLCIATLCLLPILYVFSTSFASSEELITKKIVLIPIKINFDAYRYLFSSSVLIKSLGVSVIITLVGTAISILLTVLTAYPLSKKHMRGRNFFQMMIIFTMLFSGGMIPTYLLVNGLKITNTLWALWLPGAISAYNMIVIKNFFQQLPESLEEAAKIDGCHEFQILFRIVLPLSLPAIATFALFYAVGYWNAYFGAVIYISNNKLWPIQVWLRQIVLLSSGGFSDTTAVSDVVKAPPKNITDAVIVFATMPILIVYPFLQKYFTKGALVGGVKG